MPADRSSISIRRLGAAVALVGLALAVYRAWASKDWWLGELALFSMIGLVGLALGCLTPGRLSRFFNGLAITGVVAGLAFWVAPHRFRHVVLVQVLLEVDDRVSLHWGPLTTLNGSLLTPHQSLLTDHSTHRSRRIQPTRSPFWSRHSQVWLGGLELIVAIVGGLIWAAIPRSRLAEPPTVTPD